MINYLSAYPLIGVFVDVTTVMIAVAIIINLVNVARGFIIANRIIALDALGNQVTPLSTAPTTICPACWSSAS